MGTKADVARMPADRERMDYDIAYFGSEGSPNRARLFVQGEGLGMDISGQVIIMPPAKWHALAWTDFPTVGETKAMTTSTNEPTVTRANDAEAALDWAFGIIMSEFTEASAPAKLIPALEASRRRLIAHYERLGAIANWVGG